VCVAVGMVEMYSRIQDLVSPFNKYPPGPYSLLVFGSAALLLIRVRDLENGGRHTTRGTLDTPDTSEFLSKWGKLFLVVYPSIFDLRSVFSSRRDVNPADDPSRRCSLLGVLAARHYGIGSGCDRLQFNRFWTVGLLALTKRWPILTGALFSSRKRSQTI
jgi:hypothetical protein